MVSSTSCSAHRLLLVVIVLLVVFFVFTDPLKRNVSGKEPSELRNNVSNLPTIIVITPTHKRPERLADMIRLSQTLAHVPRLHWIVVEDSDSTVPAVSRILQRSRVPHVYLATTTASGLPRRGWSHRNLALQYVRENYERNLTGVLYFADDDNAYDVRLFNDYIRKVARIGVWAVGLVGGAWVEAPHVSAKGKVIAWDVMFAPGRPFATDMAGFAINVKEVFRARDASFNSRCAKTYNQGPESCFLSQFGFNKEDLEPFGYKDYPKEILVWHTRTLKTRARGPKRGYAID